MAWFDRPAATILSTSSSRLVSGSTMPGGAGISCGRPGGEGTLEPGQVAERDVGGSLEP